MGIQINGTTDTISAVDGTLDINQHATFGGNVTIGGTITYEDATSIDSVGIITARDDIKLTKAEGQIEATGSTGLTLNASHGSAYARIRTAGSERFRIGTGGQIGLSGANYGSSGQVLTSQGSGSAAAWSTVSGTTINNNANNRVITGSGTANTLEGEANLTFDGSTLNVVNGGTIIGGSTDADVLVRLDHEDNTGKGELQLNAFGTASISLISNFSGSAVSGVANGTFGLTTPHAKAINICTSGTERLRITSDGELRQKGSSSNLGQGDVVAKYTHHTLDPTAPSGAGEVFKIYTYSANANGADYSTWLYKRAGSAGGECGIRLGGSADGSINFYTSPNSSTAYAERIRIASDGEVFIGEGFGATNRSTLLSVSGAHQDPAGVWAQVGLYSSDSQAASKGGSISFGGQDGTTSKSVFAAILGAKENSTSGNYAGYMAFYTRPAGAVSKERLRISSTGAALMGTTSNPNLSGSYSAGTIVIDVNHTSNANAIIVSDMTQNNACLLTQPFTNHTYYAGYWTSWDGTNEGEIAVSTKNGGTQYQTSSDYRRKENLVNITDGITQVKALKPYRFNMIGTPDVIRQGFLAHEVQEILPEAVSGVKDGIAAEDDGLHKKGEPIYQGLDYGRLTPILTAALKELIAEVDTLKTKVAALEG